MCTARVTPHGRGNSEKCCGVASSTICVAYIVVGKRIRQERLVQVVRRLKTEIMECERYDRRPSVSGKACYLDGHIQVAQRRQVFALPVALPKLNLLEPPKPNAGTAHNTAMTRMRDV